MILEAALVLSLFSSTEPVFIREAGEPFKETEARIELKIGLPLETELDFTPYIVGTTENVAKGVGMEAELGRWFGDFKVSAFHISRHNLDKDARQIDLNGVRLRYRFK